MLLLLLLFVCAAASSRCVVGDGGRRRQSPNKKVVSCFGIDPAGVNSRVLQIKNALCLKTLPLIAVRLLWDFINGFLQCNEENMKTQQPLRERCAQISRKTNATEFEQSERSGSKTDDGIENYFGSWPFVLFFKEHHDDQRRSLVSALKSPLPTSTRRRGPQQTSSSAQHAAKRRRLKIRLPDTPKRPAAWS